MKQKVEKIFDRLEAQRSDIIQTVNNLSEEQRKHRPGSNKWNVLQIVRHLVTAEKQSLIYIQRKIGRADDVEKTGFSSAFRHLLLKVALTLPLKFKAPKIAEVDEDYPDFDVMKTEWDSIREEMKSLIENSSDKTLAKALYRHPRAGMLNIKQALEFIEIHIAHHQKQIDRTIAASG